MEALVYLLCSATSLVCAILLIRAYRKNGTKLLLWSSIGFAGFALNNIVLVIDLVITGPEIDLSLPRAITSLFAIATLVYGLTWDVA